MTTEKNYNGVTISLNPYFNGTCSKSYIKTVRGVLQTRLNPYFNGTCSKSVDRAQLSSSIKDVLILILMEHAQREVVSMGDFIKSDDVLILILMEHAQRDGLLRLQ